MRKLVLHSSHHRFATLRGRIFRTMAQNARLQGLGLLVLCIWLNPVMTTAQEPALNLLPLPASAQSGTGSLGVDSSFSVAFTGHSEPRLERAGDRFLRQLHPSRRHPPKYRRNGSREDERFPLAPLGESGLPRREQEISKTA